MFGRFWLNLYNISSYITVLTGVSESSIFNIGLISMWKDFEIFFHPISLIDILDSYLKHQIKSKLIHSKWNKLWQQMLKLTASGKLGRLRRRCPISLYQVRLQGAIKIAVSDQSFQLYTHHIVMFAPVILSRKWDTEVFVLAKIVSPIVLFFSRVYWGIYVPQTWYTITHDIHCPRHNEIKSRTIPIFHILWKIKR